MMPPRRRALAETEARARELARAPVPSAGGGVGQARASRGGGVGGSRERRGGGEETSTAGERSAEGAGSLAALGGIDAKGSDAKARAGASGVQPFLTTGTCSATRSRKRSCSRRAHSG